MGVRAAALALFLPCALGCTSRTEIVVSADTDLAVPAGLDRFRFEVTGPRGDVQTAAADLSTVSRPVLLGLVHHGGPLAPLSVTVVGERSGSEVLRRSARTSFVDGETRLLVLDLVTACLGVACGSGESCTEAGCQSIEVDPSSLPAWSGPPAQRGTADGGRDAAMPDAGDAGPILDAGECSTPSDCDDGVACTVDDCEAGSCTHVPDDTSCADGVGCTRDVCDPTLGCTNNADATFCDDGVTCTIDDCDSMAGCRNTPMDGLCDDTEACTTDTCDATLDCQHAPDSSVCAVGELCDVTVPGCAPGPTFTEIYTGIISPMCGPACHIGGPSFTGNLDMSTRDNAYMNLVGVTASCGAGANVRVIPRDPMRSLLWRKVAGVDLCGNRMPNGRTPLSAAQIDTIAQWIEAGAADN